jgi:hypothetical protein
VRGTSANLHVVCMVILAAAVGAAARYGHVRVAILVCAKCACVSVWFLLPFMLRYLVLLHLDSMGFAAVFVWVNSLQMSTPVMR